MSAQPLTAAEALVLLDLENSLGREAFRVSLLGLIAQGVLRIEQRTEQHVAGRPSYNHIVIASEPPKPPAHIASVLNVVRQSQDGYGILMVIAQARQTYGSYLNDFKDRYVVPMLVTRGLLEWKTTRLWGLIPRKSPALTPAGERERETLARTIEEARGVPELLKVQPERAVALVIALGGAIVLVQQLQSHYGQIAEAMRTSQAPEMAVLGVATAVAFTGGLEGLGGGSLDHLDRTMSAFDAGFDAGAAGDGGSATAPD